MLLFQDGSTHRWIGALDHDLDLVVTLDDATGAIYSAILVEEEGTISSFLGLSRRSPRTACSGPSTPIADRTTSYAESRRQGRQIETDAGRPRLGAARHHPHPVLFARGARPHGAGVRHLAEPPAARAAAREIATVEAANHYLKEQFVPDYNARFAVPAAEEGSAFIPYAGRPLDDILCIQENRQVGRDNCVNWNGLALQIPPQRHRHHYVRATVRVHQYPDGRLAIFDGPSCLARFDPDGKPIDVSPLRLTPLGGAGLWTCGQRCAFPTTPQAQQQQQRTFDAL